MRIRLHEIELFSRDTEASQAFYAKAKGVRFEGPEKSHLGMLILKLEDPDGHLVEIQQFTEGTPEEVRKAFDRET